MRITAVEEYGLRCLLTLAGRGAGEQLSISEIAEMEGLSVPYVSKLLSILRKAGLVNAVRGRSGGFTIARPPRDISLYEVLVSLGGPLIDPNHCKKYTGQLEKCVHVDHCSAHDTLAGLAGHIQMFLSQTNLQDMVVGQQKGFIREIGDMVTIADTALETELNNGVNDRYRNNQLETVTDKRNNSQ